MAIYTTGGEVDARIQAALGNLDFTQNLTDLQNQINQIILDLALVGGIANNALATAESAIDSATNGGDFTGQLALTNLSGTYYADYDLAISGSLSLSSNSGSIFGFDYLVIKSDGVTPVFTSIALFTEFENSLPVNNILPAGSYSFYFKKTKSGLALKYHLFTIPVIDLTLSVVKSYVNNTAKNKLFVEFTKFVTITDLTGITLSFDIGVPKSIVSVAGSGTDTLEFTLSEEIKYGDQFDINFLNSNVVAGAINIGNISSTVDATNVQKVAVTGSSDLQCWFNLEDESFVLGTDGALITNNNQIQDVYDAFSPIQNSFKLSSTLRPLYNSTRKAAHMTTNTFLQSYDNFFVVGAPGGGSKFFTENLGDFHDFWKVEIVGTSNVSGKNSNGFFRGFELNGSTKVLRIWTSLNTARIFPVASTKVIDGAVIMLEIVRYGSTIEAFVTDANGRESLGTVTDTGSWPGNGQIINRQANSFFGQFYLYQHRSYGSDQRANHLTIHSELNF